MDASTRTTNDLQNLRDEIKRGTPVITLSGLTSTAAKAFVLSKLQAETAKTFVVITDLNKDLETWQTDLNFWKTENKESDSKFTIHNSLLTLPSFETDIYSGVSPHAETLEKRALALWQLTKNAPDFLIMPSKSLITRTISPSETENLGAVLKRDEDFPPEELIEKLVASGYVREEPLKNVGEFSVRGGILDVWSPDAENPVRIEFFGDTVDSIRAFDPATQLSTEQLKEISIAPMREFSANAEDFMNWAKAARARFDDAKFARAVKDRTDFAGEGESFSGWEFLMPLVNPREASVFDYLKDCILVVDEPLMVEKTLETFYENLSEHYEEITESGEIGLEPSELFLSGEVLREKLQTNKRIELRALGKTAAQTDEEFQIV